MPATIGMNHLGLTVRDLDVTTDFFVNAMGWKELARDETYPRTTVSDGKVRFTLWQVGSEAETVAFDRRANIGLHHLALEVETEATLSKLASVLSAYPGVVIEFMPELMGEGPRKHMMFAEPGGLRLELLWAGE